MTPRSPPDLYPGLEVNRYTRGPMEKAKLVYTMSLREQQRILVKACKLLKRQRDQLLRENYQLKQRLAERGRG